MSGAPRGTDTSPTEATAPRRRPSTRTVVIAMGVLALVLAGVVSFYAATAPDGLTKVSQDQGFADTATDHASDGSPFAGYGSDFIGDDRLSGGLAGVVGVVVVLLLASGVAYAARRRRTPDVAGPDLLAAADERAERPDA